MSRFLLFFFSPLLVTTYAVVLSLWITPLSLVSENMRLGVSTVVFIITAIIPSVYRLTFERYYLNALRKPQIRKILNAAVLAVCQGITAFYLSRIHAPGWLIMVPVSGAVVSVAYALAVRFMTLSSHLCGMGAITGLLCYLGYNHILDVSVSPWVIGAILLSGLVGTAEMAQNEDNGRFPALSLGLGYIVGAAVTYGVMCLHLFNTTL